MKSMTVAQYYIRWHYTRGLTDCFKVVGRFLWFVAHFFSFGILLRTLFAPWKRMEERGKGVQEFFEALVVNTFVRLVGFIIRIMTLVFGLVIFLVVFILGVTVTILWILFPVAALISFLVGISFFV